MVVKVLVPVIYGGQDWGGQQNDSRPNGGLHSRDLHDNECIRVTSKMSVYAPS